jgi:tRNA pseudouridine55 synthase
MDGFLNVLKPSGPTASDIVVRLKKILGNKTVGHLGTLDPGAAGVLPIAVGKGTKLFELLTYKTKRYRTNITFGITTDTLDSYGIVTQQMPFTADEAAIKEATKNFVGEIFQIPPKYSALSINGIKAYDLARKDADFVLEPRKVTVYFFDLVRKVDSNTYCFDIVCGGGTYIRSLARDLGNALNTVAHMSFLLRTKSGAFDIEDAVTVEEISADPQKFLLPLTYPLSETEVLIVPDRLYKPLLNGIRLFDWRDEERESDKNKLFQIYCQTEFFGVGYFEQGCLTVKYRLR